MDPGRADQEGRASVRPDAPTDIFGEGPVALGAERVRSFLPHREPILFLDRVLYLEPGKRAVAVCDLAARTAPVPLAGLFGESFPGVLLVEVVAQAAAAILGVDCVRNGLSEEGRPLAGVLASVSDFELLGRVDPAAPLSVYVELERRSGRLNFYRGDVHSGARRVARGRIGLAVGVGA